MIGTRPHPAFRLKVRRRTIVAGDGRESTEASVPCARRGCAVPVATCLVCEHFDGIDGASTARNTHMLCEVPPATSDAAGEGGSMADRIRVSAIMSGNVVCVREDLSLETLTAILLDKGISGVPVVDEKGAPIGVVSKTDLVREQHLRDGLGESEPRELAPGFHETTLARATVADVMTPIAFTLHEHASLSQAAALMIHEAVHRVPVVGDDGRVVGMVSSLDIMRWLAQQDGYVTR